MPSIKLANLWRIIRDVDLQGIRDSVRTRFELLVLAEDGEDARHLGQLLSGGGAPHPWIVARVAGDGIPPLDTKPVAALLVSRSPDLAPALSSARDVLGRGGVPIVVLVAGQAGEPTALARHGETRRVVAPRLDTTAATIAGEAVLGVAEADVQLALGRELPALRPSVFRTIVEDTARANASFALTTGLAEAVPALTAPLNIGDIVVLTKNQLLMSYRILLVAGRDGEPKRMIGEILGVLGGGVLFRQIARQLVGLVPVFGLLPKVAIAYAGTWAIGRAMVSWASEGREITADTVRSFTAEGLVTGREVAGQLLEQARATGRGATRRWDAWRSHLLPARRRRSSPRD
jgi:uncharacterized protein (DUF697 family)